MTVLQPDAALAYIGPGMGVGAITAVFGVLVSVFLALVALLWYPFKRLFRKRRAAATAAEDGN
ncbi:hypothetical protein HKCCE3408_07985 [Rhodobacterales bacterium HKCCE3408]|nr:hypothetical protein [Rhodobacterales bacterium HKCCE3408]